MGAFNVLGGGASDGGLSRGRSLDWSNSRGGDLGWRPHPNNSDSLGIWLPGPGVTLPPQQCPLYTEMLFVSAW